MNFGILSNWLIYDSFINNRWSGHYQGEVAKRIDIFACALFHEMKVEDMSELDLSYTPPLSSPWDPVRMSAQAWVKHVKGKQE